MPYIELKDRGNIEAAVEDLDGYILTVGELNFAITKLCLEYLEWLHTKGTTGYAAYNEIIGVLESTKLEFFRRAVAPYEDNKCAENGDVYVNDDD